MLMIIIKARKSKKIIKRNFNFFNAIGSLSGLIILLIKKMPLLEELEVEDETEAPCLAAT